MVDEVIGWVNAICSAMIAIVLIAAVLNKRVFDGIVIKVGLCSMAIGFGVAAVHMSRIAAADVTGIQRALLLINAGIAVVLFGYVFRHKHVGHALRRATDWADLDEWHKTQPEQHRGHP